MSTHYVIYIQCIAINAVTTQTQAHTKHNNYECKVGYIISIGNRMDLRAIKE